MWSEIRLTDTGEPPHTIDHSDSLGRLYDASWTALKTATTVAGPLYSTAGEQLGSIVRP